MSINSGFKPVFIEAADLNDCYYQLLNSLWDNGRKYEISSGSHVGSHRLAFDHVSGFIHFPHTRPLNILVPEGSGLFPPNSEDEILEYFNNYLMCGELAINEEYRYASWLVSTPGICNYSQVDWIIKHFKEHGYENEHNYITVGNPESNLAYDRPFKECPNCKSDFGGKIKKCPNCDIELSIDEKKRGTSPCLRGLDFRIIDGKLLTHVIYRSWDLVNGWASNMAGFTLLNEYIAESLGDVEPGPLSFSCKSLHAYSHSIEYVRQRLGKK